MRNAHPSSIHLTSVGYLKREIICKHVYKSKLQWVLLFKLCPVRYMKQYATNEDDMISWLFAIAPEINWFCLMVGFSWTIIVL